VPPLTQGPSFNPDALLLPDVPSSLPALPRERALPMPPMPTPGASMTDGFTGPPMGRPSLKMAAATLAPTPRESGLNGMLNAVKGLMRVMFRDVPMPKPPLPELLPTRPGRNDDGLPLKPPLVNPYSPVPKDSTSQKLALLQLAPEMFPTFDTAPFAPAAANLTATHAPYINQMQPSGASVDYDGRSNCGPAALAMVARCFGRGGNQTDAQLIATLRGAGRTTDPEVLATLSPTDPHRVLGISGTQNKGIVEMAHSQGLKAHGMPAKGHSDAELVQFLMGQAAQGAKFVVLGNYNQEPGHQGAAASGHYITVDGVNPDGTVHVEDPLDPNLHSMTLNQLLTFTKGAYDGSLIALAP